MKLANDFLSEQEQIAITRAVADAEANTSAEIVPVVASVSGRYDRAESTFGLLFALSSLTVIWLLFQDVQLVEEDWTSSFQLTIGLLPVIVIIVAGYIGGVVLATYVPILRRPLIGRREMQDEVAENAAAAFQQFRIHRTVAGTGLVIYISLYEHMVQILADETITAALDQSEWDAVRDLVLQGIKDDNAAEELIAAINHSGELLAKHFPIQPEDRDELKNELYLID